MVQNNIPLVMSTIDIEKTKSGAIKYWSTCCETTFLWLWIQNNFKKDEIWSNKMLPEQLRNYNHLIFKNSRYIICCW